MRSVDRNSQNADLSPLSLAGTGVFGIALAASLHAGQTDAPSRTPESLQDSAPLEPAREVRAAATSLFEGSTSPDSSQADELNETELQTPILPVSQPIKSMETNDNSHWNGPRVVSNPASTAFTEPPKSHKLTFLPEVDND